MDAKYCRGCGAQLHSGEPEALGYVPRHLSAQESPLCQRCFRITHYGRDDYRPVAPKLALNSLQEGLSWCSGVVLVVDLMDFEAGVPPELVALLKGKKVIFAVNKADLLPEQAPLPEVFQWVCGRLGLAERAQAQVILISALNGLGFSQLADQLTSLGPRVLFAGVSNAGKSSVLQRLLKMRMSGGAKKILPTVSAYPGTTVALSHWEGPAGLVFADSPGYVVGSRVSDLVSPQCARLIIPHKRLSSHLYSVQAGDLIYIAGLCGADCLAGSHGLLLGYTGSGVNWRKSTQKHRQKWLSEADGPCRAARFSSRELKLNPGEDVLIHGLGWLSARRAPLNLRIHFPAGAQLTLRPNLIGKKK